MAFLIPLLVPILIGLAVALWFSTYYAAFDFVKKRRKLIEGEIPRFALTVGQSLENDRDVLKILTSYRRVAGKDFGAELDQTIADMKTGNYENALIRFPAGHREQGLKIDLGLWLELPDLIDQLGILEVKPSGLRQPRSLRPRPR